VFRFRLRRGTGHEQHGPRYGVVVQADALLRLSTVLVAPTSRSARAVSFRPEIQIDGTTTRVLVEQVGAVDASRLGELAGHLTPEERWGVDLALATALELE
jgi:mRNA interferase MazF